MGVNPGRASAVSLLPSISSSTTPPPAASSAQRSASIPWSSSPLLDTSSRRSRDSGPAAASACGGESRCECECECESRFGIRINTRLRQHHSSVVANARVAQRHAAQRARRQDGRQRDGALKTQPAAVDVQRLCRRKVALPQQHRLRA